MISDIDMMNRPISDVVVGKCSFCVRAGKDEYFCKLVRGKKWHYMLPCSTVHQTICQRAVKEAK